MILLDTNHVGVLVNTEGTTGRRLAARLRAAGVPVAIPIVAVEEQMRGWMAAIAKERQVARQVNAYRRLGLLFAFFARFPIAPFDDPAVTAFEGLGKIQLAAMDRKIAAIALATKSLLLTANRRDFERVPNLTFANWLD